MNEDHAPVPMLDRLQRPALIAGVAGLVVCAIGLLVAGRQQFYLSYLWAFVFWIGIPLGCMAILMLQHLTGGGWGLVIRRPLETASRMLPLMAVLFVPLLVGIVGGDIYVWSTDEHARGEGVSPLRHAYLSTGFFVGRSIGYFVAWIALAMLLSAWSGEEDETGLPRVRRRLRFLSGPGLVIYGVTVSFAVVDWVMSLDPHWFSTLFGLLFIAGQGAGAFALMTALLALLGTRPPLAGVVQTKHFHDLGNFLLAFTMVWAYLTYSQYLIIWSGNIAEETPFYIYRTIGGWKYLVTFLILFHFAVPFMLLLSRRTKRHPQMLAAVALLIVAMRLLDLYWIIAPMDAQGRLIEPVPGLGWRMRWIWLDLAAAVGIGGIWIAAFVWQLKRRPLLPVRDPRLAEIVNHG